MWLKIGGLVVPELHCVAELSNRSSLSLVALQSVMLFDIRHTIRWLLTEALVSVAGSSRRV